MTLRDQTATAISNVGRRKLRSALASLGVIIGVVTIVMMISLTTGVRRQVNRQFASMGLDRLTVMPAGNRGFREFNEAQADSGRKLITAADLARWKSMDGVSRIAGEVSLPQGVRTDLRWQDQFQSVRIESGMMRGRNPFERPAEAVAGSLELPNQGGLLLSRGAATALGVPTNNLASLVGQTAEAILRAPRGETQSFKLRIDGITSERSNTIQVSPDDRLAMKSWWFNSPREVDKEGFDSVTIHATDVSRASALATAIKKEGYRVMTLEMFMEGANRILTAIAAMLTLIGSVALLVASIGIANTMVMSIYERTREIGILKAIGASRREIRQMFMIEAGFIGLIGGVCGLLLGWILGIALNHGVAWFMQYRSIPVQGDFFVITLPLALGTLLCSALIGTVAGLLPADRAARLDPLIALHRE